MFTVLCVGIALVPWVVIGVLTIEREPNRKAALDALPVLEGRPDVPAPVTIAWAVRPGRGTK